MNEKLMKLCTYFAACERLENASGPISGNSTILPKVIFRPVSPRTTKETGGQPMRKSLKGLEAEDFLPRTPRGNSDPSQIR